MKRITLIIFAALLAIALAIVGFQILHEPGSGQAGVVAADPAQQIERGRYLATAGNCAACHTVRGGAAYAGGREIKTPFGGIYAPNITPDRQTGIGDWSADDFWRALHNGKSRDGSFLYPAFPYPNYTKVTRADADAIYAYLRTIAPVAQANREHTLRFPFNQRILLAFWRTLYFTPGEFAPLPDQSAVWNRGAYLVQGLGHCSACHTSRTALGGMASGADLAGGMIPMQNWYAASLTADPASGLGEWEIDEIAQLLHTGVSQKGAVFGPMSEVVFRSLQHLANDDIQAMAVYLKSAPATSTSPRVTSVKTGEDADAVLKLGAAIYEKHCIECHRADGKGYPTAYPPLAGNRSLAAPSVVNPIRIVLNGGYPPATTGNPRPYGMPPYSLALSDRDVAAVVSYIRTSWGNGGGLVSPVDVSRFRGTPVE